MNLYNEVISWTGLHTGEDLLKGIWAWFRPMQLCHDSKCLFLLCVGFWFDLLGVLGTAADLRLCWWELARIMTRFYF